MASDMQDPGVGTDVGRTDGGLELLLEDPSLDVVSGSHAPASPHVIVLFGATGDLA